MAGYFHNNLVVCNNQTVTHVKQYAQILIAFLQEVSGLTEAYVLDYFVEKLWTKLPSSWLNIIFKFSIDDLEEFVNQEKSVKYSDPWPLSLLSFRACAFALPLSRKSIGSLDIIKSFLMQNFSSPQQELFVNFTCKDDNWQSSESEFDIKSGQHKNIPEFCRRHVKPKKQHEIFRMARLTDLILKYFGAEHIIDIGSGQGHLSRLLALCYNLKVATIEADQLHVSGAVQFDKQAFCSLTRSKKSQIKLEREENQISFPDSLPHHFENLVNNTSSQSCLEKVFKEAWNETSDSLETVALMGLHACGNLSETILNTFITCSQANVLLSLGCCYMKLDSNGDTNGYPLSNYVKSLPNNSLSYEAKEVACHALEMYTKKLQEHSPSLKIHCYRATLEKCIVQFYPQMKHLGLRGVKHAETLEFSEYANRALSKHSILLPIEVFSSSDTQCCLSKWKEVLIFYSLRLMTAPIIESLILIDRLLFAFEKGCPGCIAPIFDPCLSPRNLILIAAKYDE